MAKGNELSDFGKGEITALDRVGKSQWGISKALRRSKTVIFNYWKSSNKYGTKEKKNKKNKKNRLADQKNYHDDLKEDFF